jgi:hypothetical protein
MKWTRDFPTKSGWYWFLADIRSRLVHDPVIVQIEFGSQGDGGWFRDGRSPARLNAWAGNWAGPISEPEGHPLV